MVCYFNDWYEIFGVTGIVNLLQRIVCCLGRQVENVWFSRQEMGSNVRKVCEDEVCTVFRVEDDSGEGFMTCYPVFKGCCLAYNDFHMEKCHSGFCPKSQMFCIDHCREGRIEWNTEWNRYIYVGAGDMQVNSRELHCSQFAFPLRHYHGLTIGFDIDEAEDTLLHVMEGFSVDIKKLREKFCPDNKSFIMRAGKQIEHIFSELYDLPECVRIPYFKIKVLELLLFLEALDVPESGEERPYFYKSQIDKVRNIASLLTHNLERWYTLEELSEQFAFPQTSLKQCFKGVYGCSIAAYMKEYRMNAAALMLKNTQDSVISIAAQVGYGNPGKFAAAFRSVTGMTPTQYRKISD